LIGANRHLCLSAEDAIDRAGQDPGHRQPRLELPDGLAARATT
jgi:hypothetical protein